MKINELIKEAHENAIEKGFYDCPECNGKKYIGRGSHFVKKCKECNGTGIDQNKNIPEMLMLIITEISEAVEALRENKFSNWKLFKDLEYIYGKDTNFTFFKAHIKDTFEDEIADTFIRLFDLCGYMNIDIEKHIKAKMEYNKTRPKNHNKEF